MLTTSTFNAFMAQVRGALADEEAKNHFVSLPLDEQWEELRRLAGKADDVTLRCFQLVFRLKTGTLVAGSGEHLQLRDSLQQGDIPVGSWHKSNPPQTVWDLAPGAPSPVSWDDEVQALPAIARELSFSEAQYRTQIAYAVLNYFGLGGVEDMQDNRSLARQNEDAKFVDVTMQLFVEGVERALMLVQPEWHSGGMLLDCLAPDVEERSAAEILREAEAKAAEERAEELRLRREAREQEEVREYHKEKQAVFSLLSRFPDQAAKALVQAQSLDELWQEQKDARKAERSWLPPEAEPMIVDLAARIQESMPEVPKPHISNLGEPEAAAALDEWEKSKAVQERKVRERAVNFVEQYCLVELAEKTPDRFRAIKNGDLRVLKNSAAPTGLPRDQRVVQNRLRKLLEERGVTEVARGIAAVWGLPELENLLLTTEETPPEEGGRQEESPEQAPPAPPTPPTPPAPPATPPAPSAPPAP